MKLSKLVVLPVFLCAICAAQSKPNVHKPAASMRTECAEAVPLCVNVPANWQRLGNVFDDLGFVVAEPAPGSDQASWPQLTVAAIDVPPAKQRTQKPAAEAPEGDKEQPPAKRRSLDSLVELLLTPDGSFTSAETLQRSRLLLNNAPAEVVRVKLYDEGGKAESIEQLALIEGDDDMVYSIALRCAPDQLDRLDPIFQKVIRSWQLKPAKPEPAAKPNPGAGQR